MNENSQYPQTEIQIEFGLVRLVKINQKTLKSVQSNLYFYYPVGSLNIPKQTLNLRGFGWKCFVDEPLSI